jgi:hypothetical protein
VGDAEGLPLCLTVTSAAILAHMTSGTALTYAVGVGAIVWAKMAM